MIRRFFIFLRNLLLRRASLLLGSMLYVFQPQDTLFRFDTRHNKHAFPTLSIRHSTLRQKTHTHIRTIRIFSDASVSTHPTHEILGIILFLSFFLSLYQKPSGSPIFSGFFLRFNEVFSSTNFFSDFCLHAHTHTLYSSTLKHI